MAGTQKQGPDPAIQEAASRLKQTQLSPLEEVMFQSWANANGLEDHHKMNYPFDVKSLYQQTGGKVFPPGQLKDMLQRQADIQTMKSAVDQHDMLNPMKLLQAEAPQMGSGSPMGGEAPQANMGGLSGMSPTPGVPPSNGTGSY